MAGIIDKFVGFEVAVHRTEGQAVIGKLTKIDGFGLLVIAEVESDHEVKEKIAVYIPHKNVDMVHAREDENFPLLDSFQDTFVNGVV